MLTTIIISGKMGSGKTSLANELAKSAKEKGYEFVRTLKFAEPLYELHEYILNKMETWTGAGRPIKNGELLQYLGTEFGRAKYGENIWVNILKNKLEKLKEYKSNTLVIIDDARFPNEFDGIEDALKIRLWCSEDTRKSRAEGWRENVNHPSEIGLDQYAVDNKFDLYFNTDTDGKTASAISEMIHSVIKTQREFRHPQNSSL